MSSGSSARGSHRSRSHASAHRDEAPAHDVPEMALVHRGEPELVASDAALGELLARLRADGAFAYDSEFIGEASYFPKLCLVQVASKSSLALIDPLAGVELAPFWELLADASVTKIVHAGDSDIEPVVRHLGRGAAGVFDTQIAAGFAAMGYPVSLKKLLRETTGARLGGDFGFSDWAARPLTAAQVRYAADDVRYLPAAHAALAARLEENGTLAWALEACAEAAAPERFRIDPHGAYERVRGGGALPPRGLAALRELAAWRDGAAREADKPPRSFLKDEVLVELAKRRPGSEEQLARVRELPRALVERHGAQIVAAVERSLGAAVPHVEPYEGDPGAAEVFRMDALFAVFQSLCAGSGLAPALVAARKDVERFARRGAQAKDGDGPLLRGWRREAVGELLAAFLRGETGFELRWGADALEAAPVIPPELVDAYRATHYRVTVDAPFTLRIDERSEPLAALFASSGASSAAFLTACNPYSVQFPDAANARANARLRAALEQAGTKVLEGTALAPDGAWSEPSFLALGIELEEAQRLARRFRQNALVWMAGDATPRLVLLRSRW